MRLYNLLADCVEDRACLPTRKGGGPWTTKDGENVQRQTKAALRDGLMVGHYPSGSGSCELTDKGREIGRQELEERNRMEGQK